jgi:hypothetical protein
MRIRLSDPAFTEDLLGFLRRCECIVEQIEEAAIEAWPPPARRCRREHSRSAGRNAHGTGSSASAAGARVLCLGCGWPLPPALARLGSLRCHDCRDGDESFYRNGTAETRSELERYLAAWRTLGRGRSETAVA